MLKEFKEKVRGSPSGSSSNRSPWRVLQAGDLPSEYRSKLEMLS